MGLDTYASNTSEEIALSPEQEQAFKEAEIELCGGIYSGAPGSFRGKMYEILIPEVTGESLYQDWIPPATVKKIYEDLKEFDYEEAQDLVLGRYKSGDEFMNLLRFFRICVEHDLGLINWW